MPLGKAIGNDYADGAILEGYSMEYVVLRCVKLLVGFMASLLSSA